MAPAPQCSLGREIRCTRQCPTLTSAASIERVAKETIQTLPTRGSCGVVNAVNAGPCVNVTNWAQGGVNIAVTGARIAHPNLWTVWVCGCWCVRVWVCGWKEDRNRSKSCGHTQAQMNEYK